MDHTPKYAFFAGYCTLTLCFLPCHILYSQGHIYFTERFLVSLCTPLSTMRRWCPILIAPSLSLVENNSRNQGYMPMQRSLLFSLFFSQTCQGCRNFRSLCLQSNEMLSGGSMLLFLKCSAPVEKISFIGGILVCCTCTRLRYGFRNYINCK